MSEKTIIQLAEEIKELAGGFTDFEMPGLRLTKEERIANITERLYQAKENYEKAYIEAQALVKKAIQELEDLKHYD